MRLAAWCWLVVAMVAGSAHADAGARSQRLRDTRPRAEAQFERKVAAAVAQFEPKMAARRLGLPDGHALLQHARALPRGILRGYVQHMRSRRSSRAASIDDLINERLLTADGIAASFSFWRQSKKAPAGPGLTRVRLTVQNRGTNSGSMLRPGGSGDWIDFLAEHYASELQAQGARLEQVRRMGGREFEIAFVVPEADLARLAPLTEPVD